MKPVAALLVFSLTALGTALPAVADEPATDAAAVRGTLNLNIGRMNDEPGRLIIGSGASSGAGGLIVAPASTGASFEDVEGLGIQIEEVEDAPGLMLEPKAPASDEDDIVRLPD